MKVPISWVKDFVEITLPLPELIHRLTMAGLEVEEVLYVGLPMEDTSAAGMPGGHSRPETRISGLSWEPDKIVVGAVLEVMPHPNADRLVLCRLDDGAGIQIVLTGAPNLLPFKGQGPLPKPIKVAYAREGAKIYDGHQPGQVLMTLKRAKIRGVESYSMACSEKELGISDDHEGIIFLDDDAPVGMPLADYMGDAVLEINLTPNVARDANMLGVAREIAAITGQKLRLPDGFYDYPTAGAEIKGRAAIQITNPEMNPRFVVGLIEGITLGDSPYWMQRRLKLAGMRPISNIVDVTNYVMLEVGEPLHAFDYSVLVERAEGEMPTIITRTATTGEELTTLDGVERPLDDFTVLVCDTAGALSIAGVMGGQESEISERTTAILLEGAAWNNINIRRTVAAQKLQSEAAYRFSRGVHPAQAERGVRRALKLMQQLAGGTISPGLVDIYPLPPEDPAVEITPQEVQASLGIAVTQDEIVRILESLEFKCQGTSSGAILAKTPDHRLDISSGLVGKADLIEEIARIYGYDRIPETRLSGLLPPQRNNPLQDGEDLVRELLIGMGLQEIVSHRLTTPERENRRFPAGTPVDEAGYLKLVNPITSERTALRQSLVAGLLETAERSARMRPRMALFEVGPIFIPNPAGGLPAEPQRLGILLTGPRGLPGWQTADTQEMDFYDLKGMLSALLEQLHVPELRYEPAQHPTYHPGKCAEVFSSEQSLGIFGELHPLVAERFEFSPAPVLVADLDLQALIDGAQVRYTVSSVPAYPPVLEDLAVVVAEELPAERVAGTIRQAGGKSVTGVRLFDIYRSEQIGAGKKSLAYSITYQASDRTLTDQDVAGIRQKILHRLEQELGAVLRQ
jgi:phenylalanyl-tRNA synthetase beta chain